MYNKTVFEIFEGQSIQIIFQNVVGSNGKCEQHP